MNSIIKYALIGGAAGLIGYFIATRKAPSTNPMNDPPTDSGFAQIMVGDRATKAVFAYKYGSGAKAKFQFLWSEDRMDTIKWKSEKTGKDTFQLSPRLAKDGYAEQVISTPTIDAKYVLQWWPKPR